MLRYTSRPPSVPGFWFFLRPGKGTPTIRELNGHLHDAWTGENSQEMVGRWAGPIELPDPASKEKDVEPQEEVKREEAAKPITHVAPVNWLSLVMAGSIGLALGAVITNTINVDEIHTLKDKIVEFKLLPKEDWQCSQGQITADYEVVRNEEVVRGTRIRERMQMDCIRTVERKF